LNAEQSNSLERLLKSDATQEEKLFGLYTFFSTLLHETAHFGDGLDGWENRDYDMGSEPGADFQNNVIECDFIEVENEQGNGKETIPVANRDLKAVISKRINSTNPEVKKTIPTVPVKPKPIKKEKVAPRTGKP
jgi:hypothetical protein